MAQQHAIEAHGLTKEFKGFRAVDQVDLGVRTGAIHAIIGPNGAGKTTVFNLLSKFLVPDGGRILLEGRDITRAAAADIARMGMVRSFQISAVFPQLTVLDNVRAALQREMGVSFHFWRSRRILEKLNDRALELLDAVGLNGLEEVAAGELPYGSKRAVEIATTLALDPRVMLLDEPTAGMSQEDTKRVTELIRRTSRDRTVIMVEHNLNVVADLCDRITVLQRGRVLAEGDYDEISQNQDVIEAYMGAGHA